MVHLRGNQGHKSIRALNLPLDGVMVTTFNDLLLTMMLTKVLSCCALLSAQTALAFSPSITRSRTSSAALYSTSFDGKESSLVVDGRREFLSSSVATLIAGCLLSTPSTANAKVKSVDYNAVAKDIASIIKSDPDKGPTLVRLVSSESFCECPNTSLSGHVLTYYYDVQLFL